MVTWYTEVVFAFDVCGRTLVSLCNKTAIVSMLLTMNRMVMTFYMMVLMMMMMMMMIKMMIMMVVVVVIVVAAVIVITITITS